MKNWKVVSLISIAINILLGVWLFVEINMQKIPKTPDIQMQESVQTESSDNEYSYKLGAYNFKINIPQNSYKIEGIQGTVAALGEDNIDGFNLGVHEEEGYTKLIISVWGVDPGEFLYGDYTKNITDEIRETSDFGYSKPEVFMTVGGKVFYHVGFSGAGETIDIVWTKLEYGYLVFKFSSEGTGNLEVENYKKSIVSSYKEIK